MDKRVERDFSDGICQPFLMEGKAPVGKRHGVLLLHGFTGTAAHMRLIAESLQAQGFTVMGINLPGHGTSMEDMARFGWQDWLDAAKEAFLRLREKCEYVSVAGLSKGGCLALLLGEQMQPTALAAISAPMGTRLPLWLATLTRPVLRTIWWKPRDAGNEPVDDQYDYGYPGFPSKCGRHLARLIRMARCDLHAVQCPVLVVQSHADTVIKPDSAEVILRGVSSGRKGVLWLENAPHVCTITDEANRIAAALGEHFRWAEENETQGTSS